MTNAFFQHWLQDLNESAIFCYGVYTLYKYLKLNT